MVDLLLELVQLVAGLVEEIMVAGVRVSVRQRQRARELRGLREKAGVERAGVPRLRVVEGLRAFVICLRNLRRGL